MIPMNLHQTGALRSLTLLAATAALGGTAMGQDVTGDGVGKPPGAVTADDLLDGVGIEQHLEAMLPLDATFQSAAGSGTRWGTTSTGSARRSSPSTTWTARRCAACSCRS